MLQDRALARCDDCTMETLIRTHGLHARRLAGRVRSIVLAAAATVRIWRHRSRTRIALSRLDAERLRDIGITHTQAKREAEKPFWRK